MGLQREKIQSETKWSDLTSGVGRSRRSRIRSLSEDVPVRIVVGTQSCGSRPDDTGKKCELNQDR